MSLAYQIALAFIADLLIGDPKGFPHPVKIIARLACGLEAFSRKTFSKIKQKEKVDIVPRID